jgi:hypothetical protein
MGREMIFIPIKFVGNFVSQITDNILARIGQHFTDYLTLQGSDWLSGYEEEANEV